MCPVLCALREINCSYGNVCAAQNEDAKPVVHSSARLSKLIMGPHVNSQLHWPCRENRRATSISEPPSHEPFDERRLWQCRSASSMQRCLSRCQHTTTKDVNESTTSSADILHRNPAETGSAQPECDLRKNTTDMSHVSNHVHLYPTYAIKLRSTKCFRTCARVPLKAARAIQECGLHGNVKPISLAARSLA